MEAKHLQGLQPAFLNGRDAILSLYGQSIWDLLGKKEVVRISLEAGYHTEPWGFQIREQKNKKC